MVQIVHLVYKKYETQPSNYFSTFLLLVGIPGLSSSFLVAHYQTLFVAYPVGFLAFYTALSFSITAYRLGPWHPLYRYPGPKLARISKWWSIYMLKTGKYYILTREMHAKYGDWVRVGEIDFVHHCSRA